ncbi:MAG: hypothetical protein AAGI17_01375, partial [Planctomycetota bacterium]
MTPRILAAALAAPLIAVAPSALAQVDHAGHDHPWEEGPYQHVVRPDFEVTWAMDLPNDWRERRRDFQAFDLGAAPANITTDDALAAPADAGGFTITISGLESLTLSQQAAFVDAAAVWESIIADYFFGVELLEDAAGISGPTISAVVAPIDGPGSVLGSAGPTGGFTAGGTIFVSSGAMTFDSADVAALEAAGTFDEVILHEMGHVLGVGTLWEPNGLYLEGSGEYTGPAAAAE